LTEDAEIKERWQRFFAKLLNGEEVGDDRNRGGDGTVRHSVPRLGEPITKDEVKEALRKMATGARI